MHEKDAKQQLKLKQHAIYSSLDVFPQEKIELMLYQLLTHLHLEE